MKVSELGNEKDGYAELDYWVAKAAHVDAVMSDVYGDGSRQMLTFYGRDHSGVLGGRAYCPSKHWSDGGPIIERELITTAAYYVDNEFDPNIDSSFDGWIAQIWDGDSAILKGEGQGPTPLIAAMRAFVASKFGETVNEGD